MAHKKGGGSTRNGRDSKAHRMGVKVFGSQVINAGPSLFASAALASTPVTTSAWAVTTRCLLPLLVRFSSKSRDPRTTSTSRLSRWPPNWAAGSFECKSPVVLRQGFFVDWKEIKPLPAGGGQKPGSHPLRIAH